MCITYVIHINFHCLTGRALSFSQKLPYNNEFFKLYCYFNGFKCSICVNIMKIYYGTNISRRNYFDLTAIFQVKGQIPKCNYTCLFTVISLKEFKTT